MKKQLWLIGGLWFVWILVYFSTNYFVHGFGLFNYETIFDNLFPFVPWFVLFYISMYILVWVPVFYIDDLKAYAMGFLSVLIFTLPFFILAPGEMIRPELGGGYFSWIVSIIYALDYPHNLFPSSHVSLVAFSAFVYDRRNYYGYLLLICLSVLLVKQHYFLDVVSGLVIGGLGFLVYKRFKS